MWRRRNTCNLALHGVAPWRDGEGRRAIAYFRPEFDLPASEDDWLTRGIQSPVAPVLRLSTVRHGFHEAPVLLAAVSRRQGDARNCLGTTVRSDANFDLAALAAL